MSFETTKQIVKKFQQNPKDTGSPEVQIALLSDHIERLTKHFETHKHDNESRRGLLRSVSQRRRLLAYLKNTDSARYRKLIDSLGLRG